MCGAGAAAGPWSDTLPIPEQHLFCSNLEHPKLACPGCEFKLTMEAWLVPWDAKNYLSVHILTSSKNYYFVVPFSVIIVIFVHYICSLINTNQGRLKTH